MLQRIIFKIRRLIFGASKVIIIEDIPVEINKDIFYLVGEKEKWIIVFKCPCNCQENIFLNLQEDETPVWSYSYKKRKLTISPSVRRTKGCKSHFWVKNGRIIWCESWYH